MGTLPNMRAIQITEFGGPEVLKVVELPTPEAGEGEVLIRVTRAGLNFADTHQRQNDYLAPSELPMIPGVEVAGVREDTGERVVSMCGTGGYAEYVKVPAMMAVPIPDGVSDETAVAMMVQGMTAWHLYKTIGRVAEGESVVIQAGAGGVGTLACQLGHALGAGRVIAVASTEEKRALCLELGADAAISSEPEGMRDRIIEANNGKKVDVVFEMAGGQVFEESLNALAPFGRICAYGLASREPNEVSNGRLMQKSWTVAGFWLMHCLTKPEMIGEALGDLFARAGRGELKAVVGEVYPLDQAAEAQTALGERRTTGKVFIDPTA